MIYIYISHRIHVWYIYANIKGVYGWDPWSTIYSSTMDPMGMINFLLQTPCYFVVAKHNQSLPAIVLNLSEVMRLPPGPSMALAKKVSGALLLISDLS